MPSYKCLSSLLHNKIEIERLMTSEFPFQRIKAIYTKEFIVHRKITIFLVNLDCLSLSLAAHQ